MKTILFISLSVLLSACLGGESTELASSNISPQNSETRTTEDDWSDPKSSDENGRDFEASSKGDITPPPPQFPTGFGLNLHAVYDWHPGLVFIDQFKQTRPGERRGLWGSNVPNCLTSGVVMGDDLYPRYIKSTPASEACEVVSYYKPGLEYPQAPKGVLVFKFDGVGDFVFFSMKTGQLLTPLKQQPGRIEFDTQGGGVSIVQRSTDPTNYARNFRMVERDSGVCSSNKAVVCQPAAAGSPPPSACGAEAICVPFEQAADNPSQYRFHPRFLARLQNANINFVRFMDWMRTNNSTEGLDWSKRAKVSDATYATDKGVPAEIMVQLCNTLNRNGWFTIPHLATEDYVKGLASVISGVNANLKVFTEYSNETWNALFYGPTGQFTYVDKGAKEKYPSVYSSDVIKAHALFIADRMESVMTAFRSVFDAATKKPTLVSVLSGQSSFNYLNDRRLEAAAAKTISGKSMVHAFAIAPYFGGGWKNEDAMSTWGPNKDNLDPYFEYVNKLDGALEMSFDDMDQAMEIAKSYNVPLLAYEMGTHSMPWGWTPDPDLVAYYKMIYDDPRMGTAIQKYMKYWTTGKDGAATEYRRHAGWFTDIGAASQYGDWGLVRDEYNSTVKYNAFKKLNKATPAWWSYPGKQ